MVEPVAFVSNKVLPVLAVEYDQLAVSFVPPVGAPAAGTAVASRIVVMLVVATTAPMAKVVGAVHDRPINGVEAASQKSTTTPLTVPVADGWNVIW
jgi:hypothetical protein